MNILINGEIVEKNGFTLNEFFLCLAIRYCKQKDILDQLDILEKKYKVYRLQSGHHCLRPQIERQIDNILNECHAIPKVTELDELVTKLQDLFPKERKCDENGVPKYAYRGNKRDVTERLQKFFKLYGKYSYNDVLECTKHYVDSYKYDKTYMKILPYYIMKNGESQLATELENMETEQPNSPNELNHGEALL